MQEFVRVHMYCPNCRRYTIAFFNLKDNVMICNECGYSYFICEDEDDFKMEVEFNG